MATSPSLQDLPQSPHSPAPTRRQDWCNDVRPKDRQSAASPSRQFDRKNVGFWLGGLALGIVGCIFGARMANPHSIEVTISVLWWGIYFGCLGGWFGSLIGTLTRRTPDAPSPETTEGAAASD
jgi:hypothetical protein